MPCRTQRTPLVLTGFQLKFAAPQSDPQDTANVAQLTQASPESPTQLGPAVPSAAAPSRVSTQVPASQDSKSMLTAPVTTTTTSAAAAAAAAAADAQCMFSNQPDAVCKQLENGSDSNRPSTSAPASAAGKKAGHASGTAPAAGGAYTATKGPSAFKSPGAGSGAPKFDSSGTTVMDPGAVNGPWSIKAAAAAQASDIHITSADGTVQFSVQSNS